MYKMCELHCRTQTEFLKQRSHIRNASHSHFRDIRRSHMDELKEELKKAEEHAENAEWARKRITEEILERSLQREREILGLK